MTDKKDIKDENAEVQDVVESENTKETENTEEVADTSVENTEVVEASESVETPESSEESDLDATSDETTQEGITAAEDASREAFSAGQVTAETLNAPNNPGTTSHDDPIDGVVDGMAAYFDRPDELMQAAAFTRLAKYTKYDAFSPFPIHGMDHAMGLGPSWIPWVTFGAGSAGFLLANALQFGMMTFDWPMNVGGKLFNPSSIWPAFIPVMFELTVLLAGVTTVIVMLIAAGCFRKPRIIDREITNDRFVLWISAEDETFDLEQVKAFMESLDPVEVRTTTKGA